MLIVTHVEFIFVGFRVVNDVTNGTHNNTAEQHGSAHENGTTHQSLATAETIEEQDSRKGGWHVEDAVHAGCDQGRGRFTDAGLSKDLGCIVHDATY